MRRMCECRGRGCPCERRANVAVMLVERDGVDIAVCAGCEMTEDSKPRRFIEQAIHLTLKVIACTDCPFNHDDTCTLDGNGRTRFDDGGCGLDGKRPQWCPLVVNGAVTVEAQS